MVSRTGNNEATKHMKKLSIIALLLCASATAVMAQGEYVPPHYRADGTYVAGYYRSRPDNTANDNYSFQGNYNPYTGSEGRRTVETSDGVHGTYNGREVVNQGGQWHYVRQ